MRYGKCNWYCSAGTCDLGDRQGGSKWCGYRQKSSLDSSHPIPAHPGRGFMVVYGAKITL